MQFFKSIVILFFILVTVAMPGLAMPQPETEPETVQVPAGGKPSSMLLGLEY